MKAEIVDGKVTLDIAETLGSLSTRQRIEIALNLAVMPDVFEAVVDQLIEGHTDPLGHGYWSVDPQSLNVQRARLLTAQHRVLAEVITDWSRRIDTAKKDEARAKCHADALESALREENRRRFDNGWPEIAIPSPREWQYGDALPQAEIDAIVADVRAKMAEPKS